jgi:predicted branched-subunit amino acid permease
VILSVLAVNFRHVLYSASVAPIFERYPPVARFIAFFFLTDPQYADTMRRHELGHSTSLGWYITFGLVVYAVWVGLSFAGAWFGGLLGDPQTFALDVLLPVYFLGLVIGFRRRANFYPVVAASALGSILAFYTVGSPWHVSIGAICGILVAVMLPPTRHPEPAA